MDSLESEKRLLRLEKSVQRLKDLDRRRYHTYYAMVKRRRKMRLEVDRRALYLAKRYSESSNILKRISRLANLLLGKDYKERHFVSLTNAERVKLFTFLHTDYRKANALPVNNSSQVGAK